jgi:hypothetical protein
MRFGCSRAGRLDAPVGPSDLLPARKHTGAIQHLATQHLAVGAPFDAEANDPAHDASASGEDPDL